MSFWQERNATDDLYGLCTHIRELKTPSKLISYLYIKFNSQFTVTIDGKLIVSFKVILIGNH